MYQVAVVYTFQYEVHFLTYVRVRESAQVSLLDGTSSLFFLHEHSKTKPLSCAHGEMKVELSRIVSTFGNWASKGLRAKIRGLLR